MEKRDNPEAENSLQYLREKMQLYIYDCDLYYFKHFHCCVHICNFLVCRSVGSKGRGFFRVRVTSIKYICNMRHLVPHPSFGTSNSLF